MTYYTYYSEGAEMTFAPWIRAYPWSMVIARDFDDKKTFRNFFESAYEEGWQIRAARRLHDFSLVTNRYGDRWIYAIRTIRPV